MVFFCFFHLEDAIFGTTHADYIDAISHESIRLKKHNASGILIMIHIKYEFHICMKATIIKNKKPYPMYKIYSAYYLKGPKKVNKN